MKTKTIDNTDVDTTTIGNEDAGNNLKVTFDFYLGDDGTCNHTEILAISYYVPAIDAWLCANYDKRVLKAANDLIEKWLEQNNYNETYEFRKRLDEENGV